MRSIRVLLPQARNRCKMAPCLHGGLQWLPRQEDKNRHAENRAFLKPLENPSFSKRGPVLMMGPLRGSDRTDTGSPVGFHNHKCIFWQFLRLVGLGSPVWVSRWVFQVPQTLVFHLSVSTKGIGHGTTPFLPCAALSISRLGKQPSESKVEDPFPRSRSALV